MHINEPRKKNYSNMKIEEAISILKTHNEWRRGADIPMTDVTVLGEAIDCVVDYFADVSKNVLTWQDVRKIVNIADEMVDEDVKGNLEHLKSEEDYYTEVLRRFKEE